MKLRLRQNSVRLRLSRGEVKALAETGLVEESLDFIPQPLVYILHLSNEINEMQVAFTNGWLTVTAPELLAQTWADSDQVGMESEFHGVKVLVEKDWPCSHSTDEENEGTFLPPRFETNLACEPLL